MVVNLDAYDRRILFELDKNARLQTSAIAKKLRRSKQFVDYRIKKMEEEKIILEYNAVIDYSRLGYISIRIYFKLRNITSEQQKAMVDSLLNDKEVWWLATIEGPWDIACAVGVKNILDFYDYWDKIMKTYRNYIYRKSIVIYTHIRQFPKSYLINKNNVETGTLVGTSRQIEHYDKLDMAILKLISNNARLPLLTMAQKLKTTPKCVRNRLRRLENVGIIQGYSVLLDIFAMGYGYYKAFINLRHTNRVKELETFCAQHQNILNINRVIGGRDFEAEIQAKSFEEFECVMNEIRNQFSSMVEEYEFVMVRKENKMNYFPFE